MKRNREGNKILSPLVQGETKENIRKTKLIH